MLTSQIRLKMERNISNTEGCFRVFSHSPKLCNDVEEKPAPVVYHVDPSKTIKTP